MKTYADICLIAFPFIPPTPGRQTLEEVPKPHEDTVEIVKEPECVRAILFVGGKPKEEDYSKK